MELRLNQWHVKFYFWCLDVWDSFLDTHTNRDRSNLCQYIRTIFVWMPLAVAVNIGFYLFAFYTLLYYPITHFGMGGTVKGYLVIALIGGGIWLYIYTKKKLDKRRYERLSAELNNKASTNEDSVEKEDKSPSFIEVIWLYLVATKQKVCPTIEFGNGSLKEDL